MYIIKNEVYMSRERGLERSGIPRKASPEEALIHLARNGVSQEVRKLAKRKILEVRRS